MNNKDDNKIPLPGVYPLEEDPPEVFLALKLITMDHLPTMCKCMSDLLPNKTNKHQPEGSLTTKHEGSDSIRK